MAYDIHISKSKNWFDPDGRISITEWQELIEKDPELEFADKVEAITNEEQKLTFTLKNSLIAKWKSKSGKIVWLIFRKGSITISHPDEEIIAKAKEIANMLGAKVQGDDKEIY